MRGDSGEDVRSDSWEDVRGDSGEGVRGAGGRSENKSLLALRHVLQIN